LSAVRQALQSSPDVSTILMVHDNVIPPADGLMRLLAHQVPIIGGLYFQRLAPHRPVDYNKRVQVLTS
jgi:hypothetical protein